MPGLPAFYRPMERQQNLSRPMEEKQTVMWSHIAPGNQIYNVELREAGQGSLVEVGWWLDGSWAVAQLERQL